MQTHTPQKNAPHSARRSAKQQPVPTIQQAVQSDNDAYLVSGQEGDQTPSRKNRKPRKKSNARRNGVQSDVGEMIENYAQKYANNPDRVKHTPGRAIQSDAYAGPTFHQSPAASALPKPSFLSRSVPSNSPLGAAPKVVEATTDTQEMAKELESQRETTPLDWMFNAARQARGTPNGLSPARFPSPSPSPAGRREESDFPFELEGIGEDNSVYSTPLSHRLAVSKSPQSIAADSRSLTAEERKAKADALKKALMNLPPDPSTQLGPAFNEGNPFNAKNAPNSQNHPRHVSNPATPTYNNGYAGNNQSNNYFQYGPHSPSRNHNVQPTSRPPSSNLRNVYDPGFRAPLSPPATVQDSRISTARSPQPARALNFGAIYGGSVSRPQSEGNPVGHQPKPSLEQGLDDLKKALNMNFMGQ